MLDNLFQSLLALSGWEALATLLGLLYIILIIRESIWAWPSAFISTLIYTVLFWEGQLPLQALLNAYYLLMAVYGFWSWRKTQHHEPLKVHRKPLGFHIGFVFIGAGLTLSLGLYLTQTGDSLSPYLDAGVMVFSVMNTYLVARKVLENWLYWILINSAAILLYWQSGFYLTIALFVVYFFMAWIGLRRWYRVWQEQTA